MLHSTRLRVTLALLTTALTLLARADTLGITEEQWAHRKRVESGPQRSQWSWAAVVQEGLALQGVHVKQEELARRAFGKVANRSISSDQLADVFRQPFTNDQGQPVRIDITPPPKGGRKAATVQALTSHQGVFVGLDPKAKRPCLWTAVERSREKDGKWKWRTLIFKTAKSETLRLTPRQFNEQSYFICRFRVVPLKR